jgi:hypothetical protein
VDYVVTDEKALNGFEPTIHGSLWTQAKSMTTLVKEGELCGDVVTS